MLQLKNSWSERAQYPPNPRQAGLTDVQRKESIEDSPTSKPFEIQNMKRKVNRLESEKSRLLNTISDLRALLDRVVLEHRREDVRKVDHYVIFT
jgi:hypothetical protein